MKGFRAYIAPKTVEGVKAFSLTFQDIETAIVEIDSPTVIDSPFEVRNVFDLTGRQILKAKYPKGIYIITIICHTQIIASSPLDNTTPTNIEGITNGGTAKSEDEAGVKSYSVWNDDWTQ